MMSATSSACCNNKHINKPYCPSHTSSHRPAATAILTAMLITLSLLSLFLALAWLVTMRHYRFYATIPADCLHKWPTPPAMAILGHGHMFRRISTQLILQRAHDLINKYNENGRLKIWLAGKYYFFIANSKDLAVILSSNNFMDKSVEYDVFWHWLHEGLFTSKGEKWLQRRKQLQPAFHLSLLKDFVRVFDRQSQQLVENLRPFALEAAAVSEQKMDLSAKNTNRKRENDSVCCDLLIEASLCTLDIICESALGVLIDAQKSHNTSYIEAVRRVSGIVNKKMFDLRYRYHPFYYFTNLAAKERQALGVIHQFSANIVQQRGWQLQPERQMVARESTKTNQKQKSNYLDILLSSQALTEQELLAEIDTIILGGFDTTATTLCFLLYNLCKHPEHQQHCYEEIMHVFGTDRSKPLSFERLKQLHFLELCIKETLRLYPAAPLIARRATKNFNLNGFFIPADANIIISPMFLGRQEKFFKQPGVFMPGRFEYMQSADDASTTSPASTRLPNLLYIPFSAGQRNCIGQKYAMVELKAIMVNLLRHYRFSYVGEFEQTLPLSFQVTLHTKKPLLFQIHARS